MEDQTTLVKFPPCAKSKFIRARPDLSAKEIVNEATLAGYQCSQDDVHTRRNRDKNREKNIAKRRMARAAEPKYGPRNKFFICVHFSRKIFDTIKANKSSEALDKFEEKHNVKPDDIATGGGVGFYIVKGTGMSDAQAHSVSVCPDQAIPTGTAFKAIYSEWNVLASGIRACTVGGNIFEKDELFYLQFINPVNGKKISRPKLKRHEMIHKSKLEEMVSV